MSAEIVDHQLADGGPRLQCGAAMMRLHDDVGELEQLGRRHRLAFEHVKRGVAEAALL